MRSLTISFSFPRGVVLFSESPTDQDAELYLRRTDLGIL